MFKKTLIAAALAVAATGSFAQVYVQAGLGNGSVTVDCSGTSSCKKSSTGSKFVIGYDLGNGWAVEGLMMNYGKATATAGIYTEELKVSGNGIGAAWTTAIGDKWSFKAGLAMMSNTVKDEVAAAAYSTSTSSSQTNLSLGLGYKLTESATLLAEYDTSSGKNTTKSNVTSTGSVNLLSVGVRFKF